MCSVIEAARSQVLLGFAVCLDASHIMVLCPLLFIGGGKSLTLYGYWCFIVYASKDKLYAPQGSKKNGFINFVLGSNYQTIVCFFSFFIVYMS